MPFGTSPGKQSWAFKTGDEIRTVANKAGSIAVLPLGTIENHGSHLPVGTDSILVSEVAKHAVSRTCDDVPLLVLPAVWAGYSEMHTMFPGTVTTDQRTLLSVLESTAGSAFQNGFDAVLLLNGHGGTISLVGCAVNSIGSHHPEKEVTGLTYFSLTSPVLEETRDSDIGGVLHGGELETSLMLHLRPELVGELDEDAMSEVPYERAMADLNDPGDLQIYRDFAKYSDHGYLGAPKEATAEKGEQILNHVSRELASILTEVHENTTTTSE